MRVPAKGLRFAAEQRWFSAAQKTGLDNGGSESPKFWKARDQLRAERLHLIVQAVRKVLYLQVVTASWKGPVHNMLHIRVSPRQQLPSEAVRTDVLKLWKDELSRKDTISRIEQGPDKVSIRFADLCDGSFVTGTFELELP